MTSGRGSRNRFGFGISGSLAFRKMRKGGRRFDRYLPRDFMMGMIKSWNCHGLEKMRHKKEAELAGEQYCGWKWTV
jgi:hypothetical protein